MFGVGYDKYLTVNWNCLLSLLSLCSAYFSGDTSKMYNKHEVITRAAFDKPIVKKDDSARFVCEYGAMLQFGEGRYHAVIQFPNNKRYVSDLIAYKPEGVSVDFNEERNSFEVNIPHAKLSDAGEYLCSYTAGSNAQYDIKVVEDTPGRVASLNVIVGTSPPIIRGSSTPEVKAGELHNLTCEVRQSYPQADIVWEDDKGHSLKINPNMYFEIKTKKNEDGLISTTSIMSFTPAREEDRRVYVCKAKNDADVAFKNDSVTLNVRYAPIVHVDISPQLIEEDCDRVTAVCRSDANPEVGSFRWYLGHQMIENEESNNLILTGISEDSHKDRMVSCEARNAYGSARASAKLNFIRKPEFTKIPNEEYKVIMGDQVKLECEADGHPEPRIEWLREGYDRVLSYGPTLILDNAGFSSSGVYICRAVVTNMYIAETTAKVTVFGPPSLLANRKKYSKVGSMATLECSVSTRVTKPTNMYWKHNELKFEEGQFVNKYIVEKRELNDSWTLLLTILDLKEENFGDYNCTVFNHAGNDTATVSLMQSMSAGSSYPTNKIASVVPQDEMSIIIMGSCVAGALLVLLFAIVIALICYCQQSPKGGKHQAVNQKPPDLPPSYRLNVSSPSHHIMNQHLPPSQMQMQQDYVDMDGMLMNGGSGTPPPPPQMYPTMVANQRNGGSFFGSRADDINSIDDGCKSSSQTIYGAPGMWREFEPQPPPNFLLHSCAPQYIYPPFYRGANKVPGVGGNFRKTNYPVFYPTISSTSNRNSGGFPAPPTPPVFNPMPPHMPAVFSPAILASQRSYGNGSQRSISPTVPIYSTTNYAPSPTDSNGAFFRSNSQSSRPLLNSDSSSNATQPIYQPSVQF
ncbi:kin of IRRE-like protein 3 isoform X4 [Symsagittifera roscoffensis]|uniref:kin of IRRE-like protein 3 isoform X4 n=1 Tax=Symsagittifera roscoffensis TaxID=84072 RepID=UPI00307C5334